MHLRILHFHDSFLFSTEWKVHRLEVPQFVCSPSEGHLACFQVFTVMNKTAINIHVHFLSKQNPKFMTCLRKHQGMWLQDYMLKVYWVRKEVVMFSCETAIPLMFHQQWMRAPFSPASSAFGGARAVSIWGYLCVFLQPWNLPLPLFQFFLQNILIH